MTFFLEEFASFPRITDFDLAISMARSYNIRFFICAQNSEQLRARYGDSSDTIINNCGCIYALRNKDRKFYEQYIQPLCGTKILPHSERSYPLISFSDIQHFRCGQALVLVDGLYPFVTQLPQTGELGIPLRESSLNSVPSVVDDVPDEAFDFEADVREESRNRTCQMMKKIQEDKERLEQEAQLEQECFLSRKYAAKSGAPATQVTSDPGPESIDLEAFRETLAHACLVHDSRASESGVEKRIKDSKDLPDDIDKMCFHDWIKQDLEGDNDAIATSSSDAELVTRNSGSSSGICDDDAFQEALIFFGLDEDEDDENPA